MGKVRKSKKVDVEKILKSNPHIDRGEFEIIQKQAVELRALGFKRTRYNLVLPFMRRVHLKQKSAA